MKILRISGGKNKNPTSETILPHIVQEIMQVTKSGLQKLMQYFSSQIFRWGQFFLQKMNKIVYTQIVHVTAKYHFYSASKKLGTIQTFYNFFLKGCSFTLLSLPKQGLEKKIIIKSADIWGFDLARLYSSEPPERFGTWGLVPTIFWQMS